ncbi:MAG: hypothetical protein ABI361_09770 [Nitrososphaera sp.]
MATSQAGRTLVIAGAVVIALGLLFTLQSKSAVGPRSSFMYNNPQWTVNGIAIAYAGIAITIFGVVLYLYGRRQKSQPQRNGSSI